MRRKMRHFGSAGAYFSFHFQFQEVSPFSPELLQDAGGLRFELLHRCELLKRFFFDFSHLDASFYSLNTVKKFSREKETNWGLNKSLTGALFNVISNSVLEVKKA